MRPIVVSRARLLRALGLGRPIPPEFFGYFRQVELFSTLGEPLGGYDVRVMQQRRTPASRQRGGCGRLSVVCPDCGEGIDVAWIVRHRNSARCAKLCKIREKKEAKQQG